MVISHHLFLCVTDSTNNQLKMGKSKNTKIKNFEMAINKADYGAIVDLAAQHVSNLFNVL